MLSIESACTVPGGPGPLRIRILLPITYTSLSNHMIFATSWATINTQLAGLLPSRSACCADGSRASCRGAVVFQAHPRLARRCTDAAMPGKLQCLGLDDGTSVRTGAAGSVIRARQPCAARCTARSEAASGAGRHPFRARSPYERLSSRDKANCWPKAIGTFSGQRRAQRQRVCRQRISGAL